MAVYWNDFERWMVYYKLNHMSVAIYYWKRDIARQKQGQELNHFIVIHTQKLNILDITE